MRPHHLGSLARRQKHMLRSCVANAESCEPRVLMAAGTGFLQGVVTISGTSQGLAGATIQLESLPGGTVVQSTTTDAHGVYLFQGLASGQYRLVETPPTGYLNDQSQPNSPLTPILGQTSSSIDVQLSDPSQLLLSYPSHNKVELTVNNIGHTHDSLVGQLNISVTEPDINYTAPNFPSFCVDFLRDISTGAQNLPYSMEPLNLALAADPNVTNPGNAGAIAYLYNHVGATWSTNPSQYVPAAEAAGLQLASWELEYEENPLPYNVLTGTSNVENATAAEVQYAQSFLTMAQGQGQNELAVYLNGLPTAGQSAGSQGLIAPESLNFTNQPNTNPNLPAEISGVVYVDVNQNGQYDGGTDTPIPNVIITLTGTDLEGNPVNMTTTSAADGSYTFAGLPVSNATGYTLNEAPTPAYGEGTNTPGVPTNGTVSGDTISQITVTSGAVLTNYNFGEVTGGLSGVVYVDVNHNGKYDSGTDAPLGGVQITLTGTDINGNSVDMTTTSATDGTYAFGDLLASNSAGYTVTEAATPAYGEGTNTPGIPANGTVSGDIISSIAFVGGADLNDYDFGEVTGSLTGVVYVDVNNNGQYDSATDTPVDSVQVTISGTDIDGNSVHMATTTAVNGTYVFTGLLASDPAGYTVTRATVTVPYVPGINTPGDPANGTVSVDSISSITFVGGANLVSYNFGEIKSEPGPLPISLSGTVFVECDNDGIQQAGEPGLAGVTITLTGFNNSGQLVNMVTTTSSQGQYTFNVANPGTYVVVEGSTPGYIAGKNMAGTAGGTVNGNAISSIVLIAGADATGYNFALLHPGSLSGYVYYDLNHDGVMDTLDFGIAHVTVTLDGTNDLGQSIEMTTVTNDHGLYSFDGLRPGTYEIIRTHPPIFVDYQNNPGSLGGTAGKNSISGITLAPCAEGVNYNFGELQSKTCNLRNLAISVGNLFYHFERSYQANPSLITKQYPKLAPYLAADSVPFGIPPFPKAALASYWVPDLGSKPINIYPVKSVKLTTQTQHPVKAATSTHARHK
jgi:SdrD B-like domain